MVQPGLCPCFAPRFNHRTDREDETRPMVLGIRVTRICRCPAASLFGATPLEPGGGVVAFFERHCHSVIV